MSDIEDRENEFAGGVSSSFEVRNDKEVSSVNDIFERSIGSSSGENEQIHNDQIDLNSTNQSIFKVHSTRNKKRIRPIKNGMRIDEKEYSNAFQVLMTRTKSSKTLSKQLLSEEGITRVKNGQEPKSKSKQNENRLITPTERKSCGKRKMFDKEDEDDEDETKIGRRLESRTSIIKKSKSKDCFECRSLESNRKGLVNGLHNYFNKITPEEREKEKLLAFSMVAVKDDVNESKSIPCAHLLPKSDTDDMKPKKRQILNAIDDIQILRSESSLMEAVQLEQAPKPQSQHKKTRWSLRINSQSHKKESNIADGDLFDKQKARLNGWTESKRKSMKREVHPNKKSFVQEKKQQSKVLMNLDVGSVNIDTDNSSLVLSNTINGDLSNDLEFCDRDSENNINDASIEVIDVKNSVNDKLAPLFIKRLKPDPKVTATRHSFLHSRSPESEEKKTQRKVILPTVLMLPFPTISHITQLDLDTTTDAACHNIRFRLKEQSTYVPTLNSENLKHLNTSSTSTLKQSITGEKEVKVNVEATLQQIEQRCSDAQEMWKTISSITNNESQRLTSKKRRPKRKSIDRKTNQVGCENSTHIDIWTEKYKPLSAGEVVGNEEAAIKLRNWLKTWKVSFSKDDYSSGEEFQCPGNSSNDTAQNNQVAVLLGPHGTGKTASVYAVAAELGYTVLEVNASSRRSGRKILKELEEATKSHCVKNTDSKALTQLKLSNNRNTPENSLILVEDVDLIFDEDDGFITAIYQLSSNTKRPIVLTCRESCLNLSRMAPQQLRIYFQTISGARATALIELIALAETGFSISQSCLEKLIVSGDLRKALLKLQFLLLSGPLHEAELSSSFHETLWQDMRNYLYKPNLKMTKKRSKEKKKQHNPPKTIATTLVNLADDLDTVSLISSLTDIDDPLLNISRVKFEPAISLEENVDLYSHKCVRGREISEWLRCQVMNKYIEECDDVDMTMLNNLTMKKQLNIEINRALSQVSAYILDTRILSTDYLSTVRTICRAEDVKIRNNEKRGNRFFHYLRNLIPSATIKPHILAAACKMMQEKSEPVS